MGVGQRAVDARCGVVAPRRHGDFRRDLRHGKIVQQQRFIRQRGVIDRQRQGGGCRRKVITDRFIRIGAADRIDLIPQHLRSANKQAHFRIVAVAGIHAIGQVIGLPYRQTSDSGVAGQCLCSSGISLQERDIRALRNRPVVRKQTGRGVNSGARIRTGRPAGNGSIPRNISRINPECAIRLKGEVHAERRQRRGGFRNGYRTGILPEVAHLHRIGVLRIGIEPGVGIAGRTLPAGIASAGIATGFGKVILNDPGRITAGRGSH